MSTHEHLPFGALAAEHEGRSLQEVYLSDFPDRRHQKALAIHHRTILGLRGTGKTALARYLRFQKQEPFDLYVAIDQKTALSRIHADVAEAMRQGRPAGFEEIVQLWVLGFWTALMQELRDSKGLRTPAVQKYLDAAQPKGPLGAEHILLDGLAAHLRQRGVTLLSWDSLRVLLDQCQFATAQDDARRYIDRMKRSVIVIDSLEELPIDTEPMKNVTTALLTAVNRPNIESDNLPSTVYFKCFVPTELWRVIRDRMSGVGKIPTVEMRWTVDDLLRLICRRYANHLSEKLGRDAPIMPSDIDWHSPAEVRYRVWGNFFPDHAIGGAGVSEDVETLLMRHTQLRPRQLIQICNNLAPLSASVKFRHNHVSDAIRNSTDDLTTAAFAAHRTIHPDAENILRQHLQGKPAVFNSEDVKADERFWHVGYELGVLGPVMSKSSRPLSGAEFPGYRKAGFIFCGTAPANWVPIREEIAIHPIFHRRFGIAETPDTMVGLDSPQTSTA